MRTAPRTLVERDLKTETRRSLVDDHVLDVDDEFVGLLRESRTYVYARSFVVLNRGQYSVVGYVNKEILLSDNREEVFVRGLQAAGFELARVGRVDCNNVPNMLAKDTLHRRSLHLGVSEKFIYGWQVYRCCLVDRSRDGFGMLRLTF